MRSLNTLFVCAAAVPLDIYIVQDSTKSYTGKLANIAQGLSSLSGIVPASSQFGLIDFKDKPYNYFGSTNDYCYKKVIDLTSNATAVANAVKTLQITDGGDEADAQLEALAESAINGSWKAGHQRLLIVNTDSRPHNPNEYHQYANNPAVPEPRPPKVMPDFPNPAAVTGSIDSRCRSNDYPSPFQASTYLKTNNIDVMFVVPQTASQARGVWTDFSQNLMQQPGNYILTVQPDYSDYGVALKMAIEAYKAHHHIDDTTTTTTTPATTTTTTTTPATTTTTTTTPATTTTTTTTPATTTQATTTASTTTAPAPTPTATEPQTIPTVATPTTAVPPTTPAPTAAPPTTVPTTVPGTTAPTTVPPTTVPTTVPATTAPTTAPPTTVPTTVPGTTAPTTVPPTTVPTTIPATTVPITTTSASPTEPSKPSDNESKGPALRIRVNNRPARLSIDYEA